MQRLFFRNLAKSHITSTSRNLVSIKAVFGLTRKFEYWNLQDIFIVQWPLTCQKVQGHLNILNSYWIWAKHTIKPKFLSKESAEKVKPTCPGSLYHSSSWRRSGCAFFLLISAMTSNTSESELLEQLLSPPSDSHSDSLELSSKT